MINNGYFDLFVRYKRLVRYSRDACFPFFINSRKIVVVFSSKIFSLQSARRRVLISSVNSVEPGERAVGENSTRIKQSD